MRAAVWTVKLAGRLEESKPLPAAAEGTNPEVAAEWQLVRRAQSYEEDALQQLYQTYYPKIYSYAFLQMGDVQAAEDLASDVMLKMIESIRTYRFRGLPFGAWIFRIARNRLIDLHRRRRRRGEVDLSETLASVLASPQALAERALERGQLQVALKHLTDEQRQVIVLKFIQGFDNRSVGRIMGRSEGAIKSLQHRALRALRRLLEEDYR
ncbi:MAG: sigma-70 family RNA polymerase sigma factor [Dehalococcoidia bacterium]|nr:sigma-70 family RNA polymerase sigma factor [Dehalococcoidia bacterium]